MKNRGVAKMSHYTGPVRVNDRARSVHLPADGAAKATGSATAINKVDKRFMFFTSPQLCRVNGVRERSPRCFPAKYTPTSAGLSVNRRASALSANCRSSRC
jgi:hypothetical protein